MEQPQRAEITAAVPCSKSIPPATRPYFTASMMILTMTTDLSPRTDLWYATPKETSTEQPTPVVNGTLELFTRSIPAELKASCTTLADLTVCCPTEPWCETQRAIFTAQHIWAVRSVTALYSNSIPIMLRQ